MPILDKHAANKDLAHTQRITCSRCKTKQRYVISRRRIWFTLFHIPLFPISTTYCYRCPACANSHALARQQVQYMVKRAHSYGEAEYEDDGP